MDKNRKSLTVFIISFSIFSGLFINACDYGYFDDFPEFRLNPEFVIPLLTGSLSIEDIIRDQEMDIIEIDEDDFITIVARSSIATQNASELFFLDDQTMSFVLPIDLTPGLKTIAKIDTVIKILYKASFNFGLGEKLDSLRLSGGGLNLLLSEPQLAADGYEVSLNISIPEALDESGNQLSADFYLNDEIWISLESYLFNFYHLDDSFNHFDIVYSIHISGKEATETYEILFDKKFDQLSFFGLYGDIVAFELKMPEDTISIPLFETWEEGLISFFDPVLILKAKNSFGFETHVYYETLKALNNSNSLDLVTTEPVSISPWVIDNADHPGHSAITYLNLNRETSNLDDFINFPPKEIAYSINVALLSHQDKQGFIIHDSALDFDLEFRLPLHGSIYNYAFQNTFELASFDLSENIEKLEMHMSIVNSFPIDASLQMTFLDKNDKKLFALFDDEESKKIIKSAFINQDGEVIEETINEAVISLTTEKIKKLKDSVKLLMQVKLQTAGEGEVPIKIYSHQSIGVKMHLKGRLSVEL